MQRKEINRTEYPVYFQKIISKDVTYVSLEYQQEKNKRMEQNEYLK